MKYFKYIFSKIYRKKLNFNKSGKNNQYFTCTLYTITLITVFVPTYSVWYVILFRETGVVHRITRRLSYFFLFIY